MRILYFTDGAGIDLQGIRESVLRIAEVLTSLRRGQEQAKYVDLMQVMNLPDEDFKLISSVLRNYLVNLVQRGLHQRWINQDYRADHIVRRINHVSIAGVKAEISKLMNSKNDGALIESADLHLLHFFDRIEITIIGPGFDQIELWLRKEVISLDGNQVVVKDVIAADPLLDWFWPQVSESVVLEDHPLS